jgi:anti-sigma regulatory factor (Ser/Thr protein kinase)
MDHLRLVWQTGETLLESVQFEEDCEGTRYNVLLALQEMVTNVLRHAYDCDETLPLQVTFDITADAVAVTLRDQGPPFNPLAHDISDLESIMAAPTEAGGFGIYIARVVMDEVNYERQGGWNVLRMRKLAARLAGARGR